MIAERVFRPLTPDQCCANWALRYDPRWVHMRKATGYPKLRIYLQAQKQASDERQDIIGASYWAVEFALFEHGADCHPRPPEELLRGFLLAHYFRGDPVSPFETKLQARLWRIVAPRCPTPVRVEDF